MNRQVSQWVEMTSRVSQGYILKPLLCNLNRNDVGEGLNTQVDMFADTVI